MRAVVTRPGALWLLVLSFALGGCLADLRPAKLRGRAPSPAEVESGRELLEALVEEHGGARRRAHLGAVEAVIRDEWRGLIGWFSNPWPDARNHLQLRYAPEGGWAEVRFLAGSRADETWGRDQRGGWERAPGGERVARESRSRQFILAAYPYLFELPFRLNEAPLVFDAGQAEHEGHTYDRVLVTWGEFEPHADHDQYLLWIDRESDRLSVAEYTIRDKARFATGADHFDDYRWIEGIAVPFVHTISMPAWQRDFVHRVEFESVRYRGTPP